MKRFCSLAICMVLLVSFVLPVSAITYESEGFSSPEEAMEAYLEYMNQGDIQGMLSCFAIESYVEQMDPEAYLTRIGAVNAAIFVGSPAKTEYMNNLLAAKRYGKLSDMLLRCFLKYTYQDTEFSDLGDGGVTQIKDQATMDALFEIMDRSPLLQGIGKIKVNSFEDPADYYEKYNDERNQTIREERYRQSFGCDEYQDVACVFTMDGTQYVQFMGCGSYGGKWYLTDFGGQIGSLLGLDFAYAGMIPLSDPALS